MRWMWGGVKSDVISRGWSGEGTVKKPLGLHPKPSGPPGSSTSNYDVIWDKLLYFSDPVK